MVVKQEFEKAGVEPIDVILGEVQLSNPLIDDQLKSITANLNMLGFEILNDKVKKTIEEIKNLLRAKVQSGDIEESFSLTEFLTKKLNKEYTQVSRLFSEVECITLEQFFILQKIEKVKEWLVYDELTLSEIAWRLRYSSVAHLSAQFKKVTGFTPSLFKKLGNRSRKPLDQV